MKLRPAQVDTLARKYGIQPFWKQNGRSHMKRTESLRLNLTREEKNQIELAAKKNGGGQTAVYARTVLYRQQKRMSSIVRELMRIKRKSSLSVWLRIPRIKSVRSASPGVFFRGGSVALFRLLTGVFT